MGKINVKLPDGRVVSVDEDTATTSRLSSESVGEAQQREAADAREKAFGGVGGAISEGFVSAGDTLSLGGLGAAANVLGGDTMQRARQNSVEEHPYAHVTGEVGAMLIPGAGEVGGLGLARDVGEGVGAIGGKVLGRAAEGAILGAGTRIAETNITGDPLTIEGFVESAGMGSILNVGAGVLFDRLASGMESSATRAEEKLSEANKLQADLEVAQKGAKVFGETPPSWEEFRESHEAYQRSVGQYNREVEKAGETYNDFITTSRGLGSATEEAQKVLNKVRNEALASSNAAAKATRTAFEESPAYNELRDLHNGAESEVSRANKGLSKANDEYHGLVGSNEHLTGAIDEAEQLIKARRGMYSDNAKNPAQWVDGKPRSVSATTGADGVERQVLINQKPPITPELRAKLDAYDARISDMYKKKAGGWRANGSGAWVRDASVVADPKGALEDLRALHKELAADMPKGSGKKLRDLPAAPQELRTASGVKVPARLSDLSNLSDSHISKLGAGMSAEAKSAVSKLAKDIGVAEGASVDETLLAIRDKVRTGGKAAGLDPALQQQLGGYNARVNEIRQLRTTNPAEALEKLRSLQADLQVEYRGAAGALRDLPMPPGELKPELSRAAKDLPKSLADFARKQPETIDAIANSMDPASQNAFSRLVSDLGLEPMATPAETLRAVHKKLGEYTASMDRIAAAHRAKAIEEGKRPLVLKLLNRAARGAAGRALDFGGIGGAAMRVVGYEGAGRIMGGVERATLDGELLGAKLGVRGKIHELVSKYGRPSAAVMRKVPPILSYLGTSFLTGEKDPERDPQKQAANRIHEIIGASQSAPDNAYTALQGFMGHPGDVAFKIHQHIVGTLQTLVAALPKDPGIDVTMFGSNWTPSIHDAVALAHRLEAAQDPLTSIARALGGDGHPAATEMLWARYPGIMNELSQEIAMAAPELHSMTMQQAGVYRDLFRTPMTGLQNPIVVTTIQGLYMTQPPQPQGGSASSSPSAGGRPAAVQSPVAGSSVAALTR